MGCLLVSLARVHIAFRLLHGAATGGALLSALGGSDARLDLRWRRSPSNDQRNCVLAVRPTTIRQRTLLAIIPRRMLIVLLPRLRRICMTIESP